MKTEKNNNGEIFEIKEIRRLMRIFFPNRNPNDFFVKDLLLMKKYVLDIVKFDREYKQVYSYDDNKISLEQAIKNKFGEKMTERIKKVI